MLNGGFVTEEDNYLGGAVILQLSIVFYSGIKGYVLGKGFQASRGFNFDTSTSTIKEREERPALYIELDYTLLYLIVNCSFKL